MTSFSTTIWRVTALSIVLAACGRGAAAQGSLKCRAADNHSANMISDIKRYMSATDARTVFNRDSVMRLPLVSSSQVSLQTDERICAKLVQAYNTLPNPYSPPSLYVVKLGNKGYVAHDPDRKVGEFSVIFVFSTKYVRTGGWGGM